MPVPGMNPGPKRTIADADAMPHSGGQIGSTAIVHGMKRVLPIVIAVAIVVVLATVKRRRRSPEPQVSEGSWEPVAADTSP